MLIGPSLRGDLRVKRRATVDYAEWNKIVKTSMLLVFLAASLPLRAQSTEIAPSGEQSEARTSVLSVEVPNAPGFEISEARDPFVLGLTDNNKEPRALPPPVRVPVWDKKTWAAHVILASSMIFDVEMTHEGIAHHRCEEGNSDLNAHPSRSELYLDNLEQFAPIVVIDWLGSAAFRAHHLPRWARMSIGYLGPSIGSAKHIKGGVDWYTKCW
jgi:hypothetical protein